METVPDRDEFLAMDDDTLCRYCTFEFFKGSGPGGQHRNKVSSAVRVKLEALGLAAEDCSERTQHRNRSRALEKLRRAIVISIRKPLAGAAGGGEDDASSGIPFECSIRNPRYHLFAALLLDRLEASGFDQRQVAEIYGVSPTALIRKTAADPVLWTWCQQRRRELGLPLWRK